MMVVTTVGIDKDHRSYGGRAVGWRCASVGFKCGAESCLDGCFSIPWFLCFYSRLNIGNCNQRFLSYSAYSTEYKRVCIIAFLL